MVSVIKINYYHTQQYDVFFRPDYSRKVFEINSEQFLKKIFNSHKMQFIASQLLYK